MRHNNNNNRNRMKGRNNNNNGQRRGGNVPPRMQVFDSNGPDVRIRGTAWQVHEKYLALAKDAGTSGDIVMAENYMQHAEHYQRIINSFGEQNPNWTPSPAASAESEIGEAQDGAVEEKAPHRDDLGLPTSLFKPSAPASAAPSALETA